MRLADRGRLELWPEGRDQQHWSPRDLFHSKLEQLVRTGICPMQILEYHEHGLPTGQIVELTQKRLERLLFLALWRDFQSGVAPIERNGQQLSQKLRVAFRGFGRGEQRLQFLTPH